MPTCQGFNSRRGNLDKTLTEKLMKREKGRYVPALSRQEEVSYSLRVGFPSNVPKSLSRFHSDIL